MILIRLTLQHGFDDAGSHPVGMWDRYRTETDIHDSLSVRPRFRHPLDKVCRWGPVGTIRIVEEPANDRTSIKKSPVHVVQLTIPTPLWHHPSPEAWAQQPERSCI